MKCNCKSAGSRNTALAFINDITCVSKKSRRVREIPLLHLLRRSIAAKCTRMPWNGDERVRSERNKTPLLHFLAISIAFQKIGRRVQKTPHLHSLVMSLFHLLLTDLYRQGMECGQRRPIGIRSLPERSSCPLPGLGLGAR